MKKEFIIQVAPLIRLPVARTQIFSYVFHEPIRHGSLVEIPFYNRTILGIATNSRDNFHRKGNFQLKKVKKIVEVAMLSEKQIELARQISHFYLAPIGNVLNRMVPKLVKVQRRKRVKADKLAIIEKNDLASEILVAKERTLSLVGRKNERDRIIFSLMRKIYEKKKQLLFLVPEKITAAVFFEKIKKYFPLEKIALAHGSVSKGEYFEIWKKIKDGEVKIIIATKAGLFLPFSHLGMVVVEESGDISHKQWDMNPRYNAARAAEMLSDIHNSKLVYSNSLPIIQALEDEKKKKIRTILLDSQKNAPPTRIENVFKERKDADFPIGKELYKSISGILGEKGKTLLTVSRKGFSRYSVCRNCKTILRCPLCDRALVYFEEKEKYRCLHCTHEADFLSVCPSCGACQFSHQGVGIQLVEKKIRRLFPKARILRLDGDISKSKRTKEDILEKLAQGNFDILVGTQAALKIGGIRNFDLVAFPDFDNLGGPPDFNSRELVFGLLAQAEGLTEKNGMLFIQTSYPDDFLLNSFQKHEIGEFFAKELKERKKTGNPPFSRLVKLFFRDKNKKKAGAEANIVFGLLEALSGSNINISEPYEPFAAKKRGYYYKNILIKTRPDTDIRRLPIFPALGGLKKGWSVDVEPISTN